MRGDLTIGRPLKRILNFCVPLFIGSLFQQLYSLVDSIIVGKYLGMEAFAAIGSTGSLNNLIIGFAVGLCSGLCIPIARHFGAGDVPEVRKAAVNGLYIAAACGIIISVVMALFTKPILMLFDTPENILEDACAYIGTLCVGSLGLILYNMVIGFMRAMGDSKTPLFYLILASIFNIVFDLLFIVAFQMGVAGAALATVVAQLLASLLCIRSIRKHFPALRLTRKDIKPSLPSMGALSATAVPIGLQCSITAVGAIILQIAINGLGAQAVAAMSLAGKVQGVLFAPMDAVGVAVVFFVSQNFGAQRVDRVKQGVAQLAVATSIYAGFALLVTWLVGKGFAEIFLSPAQVEIHQLAQIYLRISAFFFLPLNFIYIYRNALQGLGRCNLAMGSGLCEMVARISVAIWVIPAFGFVGASLATPFAWAAAALFVFLMYFRILGKTKERPVEDIYTPTEPVSAPAFSTPEPEITLEIDQDLTEK